MRLSFLLLAVAALAAALAGCGGGAGDGVDGTSAVAGEPISFEQLSQAASTSAEATSGRFSFGFEMSAPELGQTLAFSGEGAFDTRTGRSSFSADLSSFMALLGGMFGDLAGDQTPDFGDPSLWKLDTVRDGSVTYLRLPALGEELPAGRTWIRAEDGHVAKAGGFELREFEQFTQADPKEFLELLRGIAGGLETVGTETLHGAETTHYRATLDAESLVKSAPAKDRESFGTLADQVVEQSGVAEVPLDVWVDGDGLVRKVALDVSATEPGASAPSQASISFELWDFGEPVEIDLPAASEVANASELED